MNRLSPLIVRRVGPMAAAFPFAPDSDLGSGTAPAWLEDARLFVTGWIGGLIFFGTFFS